VAIRPPSDIVLDVAAAVDPAARQAATDKLARTGGDEAAGQADAAFQAALVAAAGPVAAPAPASAPATASAEGARLAALAKARTAPMISSDTSPAKAMEKLEAFFLQSALQEMLPKDAENVYGSGLAGDVWKSMLAEQIAAELAKATKFGIAEQLAGRHFDRKLNGGKAALTAVGDAAQGDARNLPFLQDRLRLDAPALDLPKLGSAKTQRS
jgi:hypothetical protein